jgi:hypothetical protein
VEFTYQELSKDGGDGETIPGHQETVVVHLFITSLSSYYRRLVVSCSNLEKLKFDVRMAEAAVKQQHAARRLFLESYSSSDDVNDHLLTFIEDLVVEAEMKRTRTCMSLDQHIHNCLFCSRANSN